MEEKPKSDEGLYVKCYTVSTPEENVKLYKDWACEYDSNVANIDYVGPAKCSEIFRKYAPPTTPNMKILDAGCGTGLAAEELQKQATTKDGTPYFQIDGMDISQDMLDIANEKKIYTDLKAVDMTKPLPYKTGEYGACICVGTFTHGHVPPSAIKELIRIVKPGGVNVFTVHEGIWEKMDFAKEIQALAKNNDCEVVDLVKHDYIRKKGYQCLTVVLRTV